MFAEILGPDLLVILVIVLVLFGGAKLPQLARSLGSAKREFESGIRGEDAAEEPAHPTTLREVDAEPGVLSKDEVSKLLDGP